MSIPTKPTVFISYSHKDESWKKRLASHLGVLSEEGFLTFWDDRQIGAGEDWYERIQEAMNAAQVAILLVSANSLTSNFILREEVSRLLQRRDKEGLWIFPVILRSCPWEKVDWLCRMQVRPRDGKPLASHHGDKRDDALSKIATEVYEHFRSISKVPEPGQNARTTPQRVDIKRLPITGRNLFGREQELQQLDEAWAGKTNILTLVAWGGVGKSALVNHWLAAIAADDYRGATRVYAWSFYSQGTTDKAVSADQFIEAALTWFGDPKPSEGSPWDKGERLAHLIGGQRSLLVLDGLEPLQFPLGPDEGRLKDQALQALVRQLAAQNQGFALISTRLAVSDLASFEGYTAKRIDLDTLSQEAGAQLLKAQGVRGTQAELREASKEFGGHSLALALLGSYLSDVCDGDVTRRGEVQGLEDDERFGRHAQKVMSSYEKWFGEGPELAVLHLLGLFNRPAGKKALDALKAAPAIDELTDVLRPLSEHKWQLLLARLRRAGLLAERDQLAPNTVDAHPLVREHFQLKLKRERPAAWKAGNYRLYEHYKKSAKVFPSTAEEMVPLYLAIAHGCEAGQHEEALRAVYVQRVNRGNETFASHQLGIIGAELVALSHFFELPWQRPISNLSDDAKGFIFNAVGQTLQAAGQVQDAIQASLASLEAAVSAEHWANASVAASSTGRMYLLTGELLEASRYSLEGVKFADKSSDSFLQVSARSVVATCFHQSNRLAEAEKTFSEAEVLQKKRQPELPLLYSLQGIFYCDMLLDQKKYEEVLTRVHRILAWIKEVSGPSLLDVAATNLIGGMASLAKSEMESPSDFVDARNYLRMAVEGLRQAGRFDYLPRGLLALAKLYRLTRDLDRATADLADAMRIAIRGSMRLHQADCHLEYARLYLDQGAGDKALEHWMTAKTMIEEMGYQRRHSDVKEIEEQLRKT